MSEFSVHRTADRIPALRYCLVLDGTRIAGGKPDYRGDNHLISWQTDETYGPVDDLMAENRKLRELVADMMWTIRHAHGYFKNDTHEMLMTYVRGRDGKPTHVGYSLTFDEEKYERRMSELGIEVGQ